MDGNLPGAATRYLRFTGFRGGFHLQHRAGLDATSRTYNLYPLPVCLSACKPEKTCCCPASTAIRACLLCPHLQKMMVCSLHPEQDSELRWYLIKKCEVFHSSLCLPSGIAQILFFIFFSPLFIILLAVFRPDLDRWSAWCQHPSVCFHARRMQMPGNLFYKTIFIAAPSSPAPSCRENHLDVKVLLTKLFPVARGHRCTALSLSKPGGSGGRRQELWLRLELENLHQASSSTQVCAPKFSRAWWSSVRALTTLKTGSSMG